MHEQIDPEAVPTDEAWGTWSDDLDLDYAYKVFGGKTRNDVQAAFARSVIERADELSVMPRAAFPYYMLAFQEFIDFGGYEVREAGDVHSCFLSLMVRRASTDRASMKCVYEKLLPTLSKIVQSQDALNISRSIYGDFDTQEAEIHRLMDMT